MRVKRGLQYIVGFGSLVGLIGCSGIKLETNRHDNYYRENEFEKTSLHECDRFPVSALFSFILGGNKDSDSSDNKDYCNH